MTATNKDSLSVHTPTPEHAPLPWSIDSVDNYSLRDINGTPVLSAGINRKKNMPFIVEAVNNYDRLKRSQGKLLHTLERTAGRIADMTGSKDFNCGNIKQYLDNTYKYIKQAIEKTEGKL